MTFLSSNDTNYTKSFFLVIIVSVVILSNGTDGTTGTDIREIKRERIFVKLIIRVFRAVRWQNKCLLLNKLLSPESKTYELL